VGGQRPGHLALGLATVCALAGFTSLAGAEPLTIELGDYRFRPDTIEAVAGGPVELMLVNRDTFTPHTFTLRHSHAASARAARMLA